MTRIDICFDLQYEFINETALENFLVEARDFILKAPKQRSTKLINKPANSNVILGINKRSNPRYFRIYRRQNKIKFELELKKSAAKSIQNHLLEGELFFKKLLYFKISFLNLVSKFTFTYITW